MSFFEGAARVPLIVHWRPGQFAPRRVGACVSLVDLLPTLAELALDGHAPEYATPLDGHSLLPHLQGSGGHDQVIGEYLAEGPVAPLLMIRRGSEKFIHTPGDPDQLYDLGLDPGELQNLALMRANAYAVEVARRWDVAALHARVLASQSRRRLIAAALRLGKAWPWDHQPQVDASEQYVRSHMALDDIEAMARFPARHLIPSEADDEVGAEGERARVAAGIIGLRVV